MRRIRKVKVDKKGKVFFAMGSRNIRAEGRPYRMGRIYDDLF